MKKLTIIGGGNLGASLARGLTGKSGNLYEIVVTGKSEKRLNPLQEDGIAVSIDNQDAVQGADYIILCVLPHQVTKVLEEIKPVVEDSQVIVSTATGVKTGDMKSVLPGCKIVRAMPNTAAAISQSMTCLCSDDLNDGEWTDVQALFTSIGQTIIIEEKLMQAATVLGASGIAFFLRYIRAATQGGIQMGFHPHEAQLIAVQTAIGAATLVQQSSNHPEIEIDKVTTPRGCTIEGLNEMEHQGLSSAVIKGIMTSYDKINNIS